MPAVSHILFLAGGGGRNPISGCEHHVLTLVQELASRGVDTELIVLLWAIDPQIEAALARVRAAGARVTLIERRQGRPTLLSRLVRALDCWRRLALALRSRRERVVHMHMELVMQVLGARWAGCRRLVITIHNDEPWYRLAVVKLWFRVLVALGVRFVAITEHLRQHLINGAGLQPESVTTIEYGVTGPTHPAPARATLGLTDGDYVVGFVGRLTRQKNIPLLLRAIALRPDVTCIIVGQGELRSELEELAGALDCRNVTFVGARPDAARLMPLFDVFCLPSIWEGLGVVLLEAMLQDVPIIGSRAGAIPEVLDGGRCGMLIDPTSVASLVDAIDTLRANPARRESLVAAARQRAVSIYSVQRMGDRTCALYSAVCETFSESSRAAA